MVIEHKFYHALNILYKGDYAKLDKALATFGSWQEAWLKLSGPETVSVETEWRRLADSNIKLIMRSDNEFPNNLREIPWPPFGIYVKGAPLDLNPKIAIVGTRKATLNGKAIAKKFALEIASAGVTVISGLALGIDAAAHEGALEAKGKTIAVLANGLDFIYPKQNERLYKRIVNEGGTLISEHPYGPPAHSGRFLERNRLISGLSLGVIVVEAPIDSGALATARFALEQNRDVFVIPGALGNSNYVGSHNLIKSGAALITSVNDVLEALNLSTIKTGKESMSKIDDKRLAALDDNERAVVSALQKAGQPLTIDKIKELTTMEVSSISRAISLLQIQDIIREEGGRYYII